MSKEEIKHDNIRPMGDYEPPGIDDGTGTGPGGGSGVNISGNVNWDAGRAVGASFNGTIGSVSVDGAVKTGEASVNVGYDRSKLHMEYKNERVTGSVSYEVGTEQAKITGSFDSNGNLTGTGELKFKNSSVSFSSNNIGATYNFGGGWSGTLTQNFGGGVGVRFSGGSSFGAGSRFSLSLGANSSGGVWGVNAMFQLEVLNPM